MQAAAGPGRAAKSLEFKGRYPFVAPTLVVVPLLPVAAALLLVGLALAIVRVPLA